jgi:malate dehydrogenase
LNDNAADDIRVVVVGNPANTNCLIAMHSAPDIPAVRFSAMMRLDHNRAVSLLAHRAGVPVDEVRRVTVWGNHSPTQYPDATRAEVGGRTAPAVVGAEWLAETFIPTVQQRGAAVIQARGQSSAASAANAAIDHVRSWQRGTRDGDWVSMAVPSAGAYGAPKGVVFGYPVRVADGRWEVVEGLDLTDFDRDMLARTGAELSEERAAVAELLDDSRR